MNKLVTSFLLTLAFLLTAAKVSLAYTPIATRANELRTQSCESRQEVIKNRMANLLRMSTNMVEVFDNIKQRVQEYYQNKVLTNGKTLPSYENLVQMTQTKKDSVQTALDTAASDSEQFSCASDDPKEALTTFRKDMQSVKTALKDYRTSIKNLIVAIRTVKLTTPTPSGVE